MKRITLVAIVVVSFAAYAVADQVNFNFTVGLPGSVVASPAGLTAGPSMLTSISDSNTMVNIPFTGSLVNSNAGPATNFTVVGDIAIIVFSPGAANSVLVEDS